MSLIFRLQHKFDLRLAITAILVLVFVSVPDLGAAQGDGLRGAGGQKNLTLIGIPSATVAPNGVSFASVYSSFETDGGENQNALSIGHGFGDANQQLGFQISATAANGGGAAGSDDPGGGVLTGEFGYFGLKVSRRLASGAAPTYVGLSADRLGGWGEAEGFDPVYSVAVTRFSHLQLGSAEDSFPVMFSLGGSTGARNLGRDSGGFFGFGIGLTETIGASAAWNGDDVTLGTAFRPRTFDNVSITVALEDAFDENSSQRLSFSINWFGRDIFRR